MIRPIRLVDGVHALQYTLSDVLGSDNCFRRNTVVILSWVLAVKIRRVLPQSQAQLMWPSTKRAVRGRMMYYVT